MGREMRGMLKTGFGDNPTGSTDTSKLLYLLKHEIITRTGTALHCWSGIRKAQKRPSLATVYETLRYFTASNILTTPLILSDKSYTQFSINLSEVHIPAEENRDEVSNVPSEDRDGKVTCRCGSTVPTPPHTPHNNSPHTHGLARTVCTVQDTALLRRS
jgi:hypothetical protein